MARPEKVQAVQEIAERFKGSSAALLTEYRGLSVTEIAELRSALSRTETDYKVLKNTLARIAAKEVGLGDLTEMLEGPTAVAFVHGDAVEAARALDDVAKKFPVLVIKGGVLDGKVLSAEQAQQLAKLERREVQLAQIVRMVNTPLQQTANVLSALLRDLGSMLAQVVAQKESEAPAAETPESTPTTDVPEGRADEPPGEPAPDQAEGTADPAAETDPEKAEVTDGGDPSQGDGGTDDDQSEKAET
jgi:large subunit ribosomal protein L10